MKQWDSYHLFSTRNGYYIFDILNMECANITSQMYYALMQKNESCLSEQDRMLIAKLEENQLFFFDTKIHQFEEKKPLEVFFSLAPVTECNLQCKYCFADSGKTYQEKIRRFSPDVVRAIAHYLIENYPMVSKFRLDFVSGGEPLLDFEQTKMVISVLRETFTSRAKTLMIWLCTNGTLITPDILRWLDHNDVNIGISLDGDRETHNRCRVYADNLGSYDDVIQNVNLLNSSPNLSRQFKYLWGLCVITTQTISLVDIIKHHRKLGFKSIQMKFVRLPKEHPLAFSRSNLEKAYRLIDELLVYVRDSLLMDDIESILFFANNNDHIGKLLIRLVLKKKYIYRCYAGKNKLAFTPNGDIYPCDSFVGNSVYKLGNIYLGVEKDGLKNRQFQNLSVLTRPKCRECWARFICGGDCLHNSLCANGNIETPDDIFCEITKYSITGLLDVLNVVNLSNQAVLIKLKKYLLAREKTK